MFLKKNKRMCFKFFYHRNPSFLKNLWLFNSIFLFVDNCFKQLTGIHILYKKTLANSFLEKKVNKNKLFF